MGHFLTINSGSSSIKFALFQGDDPQELMRGQVEGLGASPRIKAVAADRVLVDQALSTAQASDHMKALAVILDLMRRHFDGVVPTAIGHRIVHGGPEYCDPLVIDAEVEANLTRLTPLAPLHQPHNLAGVQAARAAFPEAVQVGCFDTAFHRQHPWVADTYALPKSYYDEGIRRYGFHGLSYEYVSQELARIAPRQAKGRNVITHLGNGASMCAALNGQSVSSSMGFTALDGLAMGSRCGQLDPGVVLYLMAEKNMSAKEIEDLLYRNSGLKGLSGLSQDMRELENADTREAAQAIEYFVSRIRRELGAMTASLSGLDNLVFCGGIGENARQIRARVCAGFEWLGLELDENRNRAGAQVISSDRSRVQVFVITTNEELMIARHTANLVAG